MPSVLVEQVQREPRAPVDGQDGTDGRGITSTSIRAGRLVVPYSDGTPADASPTPPSESTDTPGTSEKPR
ncbi:hypothetical protein AB0I53_05995 [Saccharopolyspora sp. NPDC050389]|uniref:hypothetical protein n=1 Tax=Saccharopolyspora sp. NPDC050389 TaxID=3155516 RepID=UPI00340BBA64